jgi:hypothetical protein
MIQTGGDKMGVASGKHGRDEKCLKNLVGNFQWKIPLGRTRSRWESKIKLDLK